MSRIIGLDISRTFAIWGMILVNYKIIHRSHGNGPDWLVLLMRALEGRFASLFVLLAGIGFGLMYQSETYSSISFRQTIQKRILFLLVLGLLHQLVWRSDILHFYAFYFLIGLILVTLPTYFLLVLGITLPVLFSLLYPLDSEYHQGWDYLLFGNGIPDYFLSFGLRIIWNGYHPIIPWLSFFIFGLLLSRGNLQSPKTQRRILVLGLIGFICSYILRLIFFSSFIRFYPYPPNPLFILTNTSSALIILGLSLTTSTAFQHRVLEFLGLTGKYALTIYLSHTLLMLGAARLFSWYNMSLFFSIWSTIIFITLSMIFVNIWSNYYKSGPLEALMRHYSNPMPYNSTSSILSSKS